MHLNFVQLERAALADNLPAIVEALIACPSAQVCETPGWVTRKSREWIIKLMKQTSSNGRAGEIHLKACRSNMVHARRFEKVNEIIEQQNELSRQVCEIEELAKVRRANPRHGLKDLRPDLHERQEYLAAVGRSLQSACAAASRLLAASGLRRVSPAAILRSYKLVEHYELDGPYYIPQSVPVLAVFGIHEICRGQPKVEEFEVALLDERYSRLRPASGRHCRPVFRHERGGKSSSARPQYTILPWALDPPSAFEREWSNPVHALEHAVRSGNPLALVSGLDLFNRLGGLAPTWLLQSAASWIIALLKRKGAAGARSILTNCTQRFLDCERYLLIERKQQERLDLSTQVKLDCKRKGFTRHATAERLGSLGLLYAGSLDAAIRETLADLRGTPLDADFAAAKKAFNRVRKAPHVLREHWVPPEYVAMLLGLPVFEAAQKVGNEYPHFAQLP